MVHCSYTIIVGEQTSVARKKETDDATTRFATGTHRASSPPGDTAGTRPSHSGEPGAPACFLSERPGSHAPLARGYDGRSGGWQRRPRAANRSPRGAASAQYDRSL